MVLVKDMDPKNSKTQGPAHSIFVHRCRAPPNAHPTRNQLSNFAALGMDVDIQDAQPDPHSQRSSRQRSSRVARGPHRGRVLTARMVLTARGPQTWPSSHGGDEAALTEKGGASAGPSKSSHTARTEFFISTSTRSRTRKTDRKRGSFAHASRPRRSPQLKLPLKASSR